MLVGPADDDFHAPTDEQWWYHETSWFSFFVPERRLGGWHYNWIRPNIGVCGGGCWVWDDTTFLHWEVPYYANYTNLRLPEERDLRDFTYPSGASVRMLEPLSTYRIGHKHDDLIDLDLEFDAVMPPWVSSTVDDDGVKHPHHFDQFGRVTGSIILRGEQLEVDCLAMRDRTWTFRSEFWKRGGGYGYTTAAADSGDSFLFVGGSESGAGFLSLKGRRAALADCGRHVERDSEHGYVTRVVVAGDDVEGRVFEAEGKPVSRMAMPVPGVAGVVWTSLLEWEMNGVTAWGEDQEPWPVMTWSTLRHTGDL